MTLGEICNTCQALWGEYVAGGLCGGVFPSFPTQIGFTQATVTCEATVTFYIHTTPPASPPGWQTGSQVHAQG
ncbi:MAG: hypothetical protein IPG44_16560 [Anaerolineales bacterium]|nr:hypothetical protein [Anaerolineales bacterium]